MNRVILDMDPGVDDALAILLSLNSPEFDVIGISTVSGNVGVELCTRNALRVLTLVGRTDIPVHSGMSRPLKRMPIRAELIHGMGGLGDADPPEADCAVESGDAVGYLVGRLNDESGEILLIATGPATNLAQAERRSPGILKKARRVILMGGAVREGGNATPTGEFNFVADPHAAQEVLRSGGDILLVPLDVTHRCLLTEPAIRRLADQRNVVSEFVLKATAPCRAYMKKAEGVEGIHLHDPLAVGVGIDPTLCDTEVMRVEVETEGELTAGQVVVDRRQLLDKNRNVGVDTKVCVRVDRARFLDLFLDRVGGETLPRTPTGI